MTNEEEKEKGWPAGQVEEAVTRLVGVAEGLQVRIDTLESLRRIDLKLTKDFASIRLYTSLGLIAAIAFFLQFQFKNALETHQQDFHGYREYLPEE